MQTKSMGVHSNYNKLFFLRHAPPATDRHPCHRYENRPIFAQGPVIVVDPGRTALDEETGVSNSNPVIRFRRTCEHFVRKTKVVDGKQQTEEVWEVVKVRTPAVYILVKVLIKNPNQAHISFSADLMKGLMRDTLGLGVLRGW
jgi:hypothetical protein